MEKSPTYAEFLRQLPSSWQPEVPENAPQTMEELFARIGEFKDLVLLIDEIDKIVEDEEKHRWRLLHKLRSLCNEKQFHVVFTGENSINRIYDRGTGPLHNFTTRLPLPLLNDREVNELVTNPMKDLQIELEESDQIVETIQAFSWGHPAVVQYICRRLIRCANKKHRRNIKLSDVQGVLNDPDFQRSEFLQTFWEGSVPLERIISITMAGQPQAFTLEDVQKQLRERHRLDEPDHIVLDALDTLVDIRAILQRTSQGFEYAIPQFKQILMTQVQADGLLRSNLSEFRANKADPISGKPTPKP